MKINLKRTLSSLMIAATMVAAFSTSLLGQTTVFLDDFDSALPSGVTRTFTPDNSAVSIPGSFPTAAQQVADGEFDTSFDIFGIVNRDINNVFKDDSANPSSTDTVNIGIANSTKTDNFLGYQDVENPDHSGSVFTSWMIPVSGRTGLEISFDVAAMGDFEPDDVFSLSVSFDSGSSTELFNTAGFNDEVVDFVYTLEDGSTTTENDPFVINNTTINNVFQNFSAPISGVGTTLQVDLEVYTNSSFEAIGVDNLLVTAAATGTRLGDFDNDGDVDLDDINEYAGKIGLQTGDAGFDAALDLDGDGTIELVDDHDFHIENYADNDSGIGTFIGDVNLDGDVDVSQIVVTPVFANVGDASLLLANLGTTSGALWENGDLNADGDVDVSQIAFVNGVPTNLGDASRLLANLGQPTGGAPAASAVPEPGSLAVLALTGIAGLIRRRK